MRLVAAVVVVVAAFILIPSAVPSQQRTLPIRKAERSHQQHRNALVLPDIEGAVAKVRAQPLDTLGPQLDKSRSAVRFFENRGRWLRAPMKEKCWQVPWQRSCTIARHLYRMNSMIARLAAFRLAHEIPNTNDWVTAVRIVQRVYPGTADWMLYISHREGGYGDWVWYGGRRWAGYHIGNDFLGADTVGGWMQFRFSTFAPYWRGALKDLHARGFTIPAVPDHGGPAEYQPWLWPLGQALTAGYMRYYGKDGCHWCL